jgi:Protein of unknown function (DUF3320)
VVARIDAALRAVLERNREMRRAAAAAAAAAAVKMVAEVLPEVAEAAPAMEMPGVRPDRAPAFAAAPLADASAIAPPSVPMPGGPSLDVDRFFDADYSADLQSLITTIVAAEGPLPLSLLARKVAQVHGWQRTGHRIQERVAANLQGVEQQEEDGVTFLWAPGTWGLRRLFRGLADRTIRDVSRTEIAALHDSKAEAIASAEDPALELARELGIARLSQDARVYLTVCMAWHDANPAGS